MAAQGLEAFLRIGQRRPQRPARSVAALQMGDQPARAELGDPGRVAGPRHQAIAKRRGAIQDNRGIGALGEGIFIDLGGITRQRQIFHQFESHVRA